VKNQILSIPQPTYFPDLASCNLWLFPILKTGAIGNYFASVEEVQQKTIARLPAIPT
jgi:hypothetical protein